MRYKKCGSQSYEQRKPKVFVPKGLKGKDKQFYKAVSIRSAGPWSGDLLANSDAGKLLAIMHFENVKKQLEEAKPKNKTELQKVLKKALITPQQKFVILYEKGLREPLSTKEFHEYLELFKTCFPTVYKTLYGKKSPSQIVAECIEAQKQKQK
jgi:hypothetical protein